MQRLWLLLLAAFLVTGCGDTTTPEKKEDKKAEETASVEADADSSAEVAKKEPATDPAETTESQLSPQETLDALSAEFSEAQQAFMTKVRAAPRSQARKIFETENPASDFAAKFMDFAEANPGTAAANQALVKAVENGDADVAKTAASSLIEADPAQPQLARILAMKGQRGDPSAEALLKDLVEKTSDRETKGWALHGLANMLNSKLERGEGDEAAVAAMFTDIKENYGDIDMGRGQTLADAAEGNLFVLNNLSIGKVAPDIEGTDLDGEDFKLSDYRGKVVMLDFWGDW